MNGFTKKDYLSELIQRCPDGFEEIPNLTKCIDLLNNHFRIIDQKACRNHLIRIDYIEALASEHKMSSAACIVATKYELTENAVLKIMAAKSII